MKANVGRFTDEVLGAEGYGISAPLIEVLKDLSGGNEKVWIKEFNQWLIERYKLSLGLPLPGELDFDDADEGGANKEDIWLSEMAAGGIFEAEPGSTDDLELGEDSFQGVSHLLLVE